MLTRLKLENFKAWREGDLRFGKVTGLFGTNSAGKSSILQLLLLLKQTKNATDRGLVLDFGSSSDLVNPGSFEDIVYRHDKRRRISWLLEWTLSKTLKLSDPTGHPTDVLFEGNTLENRCKVGLRREGRQEVPWLVELQYRFDCVDFRLQRKSKSETKYDLTTSDRSFGFRRNKGRAWPLPHPRKTYLFPTEIRSFYQNADFLINFELEYEKLMDSIYYLGPLREYPRREYHWSGSNPDDVGQRGERTVDAVLAATLRGEKRSLGPWKRKKPFQEMIAYWLRELGLISHFGVKEIAKGTNVYHATITTSETSVPTVLTDVGFGVSQVLPALVLLYYVPEGSTVLLEQPEIHLHPAVQSRLADVMLNVANARKLQIIVESHSEHLLRRLQRRVAEGQASSNDVKLYFVSTSEGSAHASDLALNEFGLIENWPPDFFGDEMGEIAAITKASLDRRLEKA